MSLKYKHKYEMDSDGYYGVVTLPYDVFTQLNSEYFISGCTDKIKFMCANKREADYLEELGVLVLDCCDWYKIYLEGGG